MIKQKKWESAERYAYEHFMHLSRRRAVLKAYRFRVRFYCWKCKQRKKYVPEQIIEPGEYKPFDFYMCRCCEEFMRGGRH